MTESLSLIEHAAQQSDRWLFIAVEVAFAIAIIWYIRKSERRLHQVESGKEEVQKEYLNHVKTESLYNRTVIEESTRAIKEFNNYMRRTGAKSD